jgi:hypothetical protein
MTERRGNARKLVAITEAGIGGAGALLIAAAAKVSEPPLSGG